MIASNPEPNIGDVVTFTINLSNFGDVDATGVAIENFVPAGFDNVTAIDNSGTFSFLTDMVTWT